MNKAQLLYAWLVGGVILLSGCSGSLKGADSCPGDPDAEAAALRKAWEEAPAFCRFTSEGAPGGRSKELIRRQAANLLFRYPEHVPTRMLNAILAYEARESEVASIHLDALLRVEPVYPDAVVLRSRIALEAGNFPYAIRLLRDQAMLRPEHAGLREVLASAYHFSGDDESALESLSVAERLGAPQMRVHYNRGLIAESGGDHATAVAEYKKALAILPNWPPAASRLRALDVVEAGAIVPPPPPSFIPTDR